MTRSMARRFSIFSAPGMLSTVPAGVETGGGGGGGDNDTPQGTPGTGESQQQAGQQGDLGFPANTPVAEMTDKEQAAYWRNQSRVQQRRAESRGDYDALKQKADRFDEAQRAAETEHEKAIREAREQAKAEGRAEARAESTKSTVTALLQGALKAREVPDDEIASQIKYLNLDSFTKEGGEIDHDAITGLATRLAGAPKGGSVSDHGGGRRGHVSGSRPGSVAEVIEQRRAERDARQTSGRS